MADWLPELVGGYPVFLVCTQKIGRAVSYTEELLTSESAEFAEKASSAQGRNVGFRLVTQEQDVRDRDQGGYGYQQAQERSEGTLLIFDWRVCVVANEGRLIGCI